MLWRSSVSKSHKPRLYLSFFVFDPDVRAAPVAYGHAIFKAQIQPVFVKYWLPCHNAQSKQAGLDLSTHDGLLHGGGRGPAVVPGNAAASLLYKLITRQEQPAMPYKSDPMPKEVADRIADWIN